MRSVFLMSIIFIAAFSIGHRRRPPSPSPTASWNVPPCGVFGELTLRMCIFSDPCAASGQSNGHSPALRSWNVSSPRRAITDLDDLGDERHSGAADATRDLPTPRCWEHDVCRLETSIAVAARHFRSQWRRDRIEAAPLKLELT